MAKKVPLMTTQAAESISNDCENELTEANAVLDAALDALTALAPAELQA